MAETPAGLPNGTARRSAPTPAGPVPLTPLLRACQVCGHHALQHQEAPDGDRGPRPRMVCVECGAHQVRDRDGSRLARVAASRALHGGFSPGIAPDAWCGKHGWLPGDPRGPCGNVHEVRNRENGATLSGVPPIE